MRDRTTGRNARAGERRVRRPRPAPRDRANAAAQAPSSGARALDVRPRLIAMGVDALVAVLAFTQPADLALRRYFRDHPDLGRRDRAFIADSIYAALRRLRHYTDVAGGLHPRRIFIAAAQSLAVAEGRDVTGALASAAQASLAGIGTITASSELGVRAELPDWVIDIMRRSLDDEQILAIGTGMQEPAPLDLRVNTQSITRDAALEQLRAAGLQAQSTRLSPIGIRLLGKPALERHPLYTAGAVEVQDEGSQLISFLVAPRRREMVVDFCAGAGGKTLALGAMMRSEGRLYAFDVSHERMRRLRARLARSGLSNVQPEVLEGENDVRLKRLAGKIDRVLVDAPCTGFGTLRRNPDLKFRHRAAAITEFTAKQLAILESAARLVKPGGRLVYATCSILEPENEAIVAAFRARHPEFVEVSAAEVLAKQGIPLDCGDTLKLLPHRDATDGFFAAVLERAAANRAASPD